MPGELQGSDQDPDCEAEASRGQGWVCREVCSETSEGGDDVDDQSDDDDDDGGDDDDESESEDLDDGDDDNGVKQVIVQAKFAEKWVAWRKFLKI